MNNELSGLSGTTCEQRSEDCCVQPSLQGSVGHLQIRRPWQGSWLLVSRMVKTRASSLSLLRTVLLGQVRWIGWYDGTNSSPKQPLPHCFSYSLAMISSCGSFCGPFLLEERLAWFAPVFGKIKIVEVVFVPGLPDFLEKKVSRTLQSLQLEFHDDLLSFRDSGSASSW